MRVITNWSCILLLAFCSAHVSINKPALVRAISRGQVYSVDNWISGDHIENLRCLCLELQEDGRFLSSGLSYDESSELLGETVDRLVCDEISSKHSGSEAFKFLIDRIDDLRLDLSVALRRYSMECDELPHESYMSLSPPGSILKRHLDERHEELKYAHRWGLPTRRSISWLLYLNPDSWDASVNGGQLRYYPQRNSIYPSIFGDCGCHEGNLQIGWLNNVHHVKPVYMQSWAVTDLSSFDRVGGKNPDWNQSTDEEEVLMMSALYILSIFKRKIFITSKFSPSLNAINKVTENLGTSMNFHQKCLYYAKQKFAIQMNHNFSLVENYALWSDDASKIKNSTAKPTAPHGTVAKELLPKGGTLCLFDSVSVPHEVLCTLKGDRIAIAGWFHETVTQPVLLINDDVSSDKDSAEKIIISSVGISKPGSDKIDEKSMIKCALKGMYHRSGR